MTHPHNEFADFESSFQTANKAEAGGGGDQLPEGVYKFVCSSQDVRGDGVQVDHEVITSKAGSKGLKLFLEVLDPESVKVGTEAVRTRGQVIEHVFWVTQKNLPYLKRDASTILGRDVKSLAELQSPIWAGKTVEGGVKHEVYNGFKNARISFFNAWAPKKGEGAPASGGKPATATAGAAKSKEELDF